MCDVEECKEVFSDGEGNSCHIWFKRNGQYKQMHTLYQLVSENSLGCTCVYLCFLATFTKGKVLNNFSSSHDDQRIVIFKILEPDR